MVRRTRKTQRTPTRSMVVKGDHVVPRRTPPKRGVTRSMVVRGNTGPLTIPALRRAFESVDRFVAKKPSVAEFQKFWKKTFGKPVSAEAARDYLQFAAAKKTQSGGALTGAPLSYELGQPAGPAPNAQPTATPYVSTGFGFANVPGFISQCGTVDTTNPVPADMGSNKVGGGRSRRTRKQRGGAGAPIQAAFAELLSNPFGMGSPPSPAQTAYALTTGYNQFNSPRPELNNNINFHKTPTVFTGSLPPSSITY